MPTAPDIQQPPGFRQQLRGMFQVRSAPPRRWRFALRAAGCMGAPILAGWLAGDLPAGMMAATGGFTALYGSERPYINRARELAAIALAFALSVGLGMAAAAHGAVAVVLVVSVIAMVATWMGNAFQIGPPGAYMFLLASAAASGMYAPLRGPVESALLVLAGGAFAWCMHMLGALFDPRGPEKAAVLRAGDTLVAYVEAVGTPAQSHAGHVAARALYGGWSTLVSYQPKRAEPGGRLTVLRAINRRLHALFADAMSSAGRGEAPAPGIVDEVRRLQAQARSLAKAEQLPQGMVPGVVPQGHPGALAMLGEALRPGALSRTVVLRVGLAALLAGWLGSLFHLERSYWAVAAAVLMLHQGFDWNRTLVRSIERLLGTWVGLLLGGAIILLYPQGIWLVLAVMGLQFAVEMLVVRNYAMAVVFITSAALLLASGGHPVESPGAYVLARGVDTAVGCLVALLVFRLLPSRPTALLPPLLAGTLRSVDALVVHLAAGDMDTPGARTAQRDLQRQGFLLEDAYESAMAASAGQRAIAERQWPAVAASLQLAYRALSAGWTLDRMGAPAATERARRLFGDHGEEHVREALRMLAASAESGEAPAVLGPLPPLFERELRNLHDCLSREPARPLS